MFTDPYKKNFTFKVISIMILFFKYDINLFPFVSLI